MADSNLKRLCEILARRCPEAVELLTTVTEADFDDAFAPWLARAIHDLEANSKNFAGLGETGLVAALAMGLRMPGLTVSQEENSNGHVDLTVSLDHSYPLLFSLGEAKVYDGPNLHKKGLAQLMGRYMTGREAQCLMLSFVKKKNIAGIAKELREDMDKSMPSSQQGKSTALPIKWAFKTAHLHATGDLRTVAHYNCNLFNPVSDASASSEI
ncbi:hypothetical protein FOB72_11240 [Cupriavidus pauculus]|uniref:Uncharacterized protein n=1 Tax=Cupriavidus pauculus TaxID=82633 RepID=A0A5P2H4G2_9BURK|nr:hypothetical protein [Cupriavidus pauculus]QET02554.1 hypothetical protein FOB72_11240 [Cupriavidus pauculus]